MDCGDVRVVERRRKPRLLLEPRATLGVCGDAFGQDLDGNATVQARVRCLVHRTHAALADGADDLVVAEPVPGLETHPRRPYVRL